MRILPGVIPPAGEYRIAPCCNRLSRLEAAPTKLYNPAKPKSRLSNNLPHYIISDFSMSSQATPIHTSVP
jgi:hypothetical protein